MFLELLLEFFLGSIEVAETVPAHLHEFDAAVRSSREQRIPFGGDRVAAQFTLLAGGIEVDVFDLEERVAHDAWVIGLERFETRDKAIGYYERQLAMVREIGDRPGEGAALGNLGAAYRTLGQAEKAIGFFEQELLISREIGDRRGEGAALGSLGVGT